jgi:GNAT superfamily N-acetyltransferase
VLKPMIRFEQLGPDEGTRLRAIRLRALQDAPDAFGTTFEQAFAHSDDVWAKQVVELPTFVIVYEDDGRDVAMVRCARDQDKTDTAWLISMWVAPEIRRAGAGGVLVDLVVAWAHENGISRLVLDVADLNRPAIALYESKGFAPNGKIGTMPPPRQHIREHQRELRLAGNPAKRRIDPQVSGKS